MSFRRALVGGAAAALALLLPVEPVSAAPARIERSAEFVKRVNTSIDSGVEWLLAQQRADGGWTSFEGYPAAMTAICYHTLRVCGVSRDDPAMVRAYEALHREYVAARKKKGLRTYSAALIMMAIEQHGRGAPARGGKKSRYARGGDGDTQLDKADLAWMRELVRYVQGSQAPNGSWRYGEPARYGRGAPTNDYDHSNMQYALLGLKSASRSGVKVDASVYKKALEHLVRSQAREGPDAVRVSFASQKGRTHAREMDRARGWGYVDINVQWIDDRKGMGQGMRGMPGPNEAYGSMTAGSLGAVVICRSELLGSSSYPRALDARAETSIWDGIAWLGQNFEVAKNPNYPGWHYYYLYALERAGVLAGLEWMGEHDWYGEGAEYLLRNQLQQGYWLEVGPFELATCFALLFLKKGTLPVRRGAVTPSVDEDPIHFDRVAKLGEKDFHDFVDLVISRYGRSTSAERRAEWIAEMARVGPRIVEPLIRRMATGGEAQRRSAYAILRGATDLELAFVADAPAEKRFDQLAEIEGWYMLRAGRLHYDRSKRRIATD